jgi:hypothetical protein
MPLSGQSPTILHILKNVSLFFLSALFAPLCTYIAIIGRIISPFAAATKRISGHRKWLAISSTTFQPRMILVTGVGMSKGLSLARTFYRAGHRVIGTDFEPHGVRVCGRFSVALGKFYKLSTPSSAAGSSRKYDDDLIEIVKREKVKLWVSCSGVASAIEDGEAAEAVEKLTKCKTLQFGVTLTKILHEEHSFMENTRNLGLNIPDTDLITSAQNAMGFFYLTFPVEGSTQKKCIMKSVGLNDTIRADMTLLPRPCSSETHLHLSRLNPSPSRPFVLQQFISGPECCTHSLIIKGQVLAFTACRSSDLLMHYKALPSTSLISQAMLKYTQTYAKKTGPLMTGHFSIDFLLNESDDTLGEELMQKIYPIECNPRAHTAVVLFANESEDLAEAYLSILRDHSPSLPKAITLPKPSIITSSTTPGYYWVGYDLVTLVIVPFYDFALLKIGLWTFLTFWVEFVKHVLF